ncbi:glycosyltransferase [Halomonas sp. TBZ9]|uniref:Glycosyltransferase n=1 Tax=Vreelandella azerica TaxID=2732867 RepID=A0A7Y3TY87_9GAMM|nr:glycosyltransferase [Halomonas azerica]NOG32451.1 glycosyltransferase [Halomonas azerica]
MNETAEYSPEAPRLAAKQLRVAIFSDSLAERNGTGAYYHDLLAHLHQQVATVETLQPKPRGRVDILSVPLPGDATQRLVVPNLWRVNRQLAELRPNIIVSVTPGPFGMLGLWMARRHGCGFISAYHTDFEGLADLYWGPVKKRVINGFLQGVNRFISRRSGTVLVNNSDLVQQVKKLGATQVDIMGTPLEPGFLEAPAVPPPGTLAQVCYAGRLAAEKNIDAFIEAARCHPELNFVMGGDGPLRKVVEQAARELDNLDYRGWLSRDDLRALIDQSSLLVLPSHMETFGSIALEALSRGRPALVSENAGIHDWQQLAGVLIPLRQGESVASILDTLAEWPAERWQEMAQKARQAAITLNQQTVAQWLDVLAGHARGGRS